MSLPAAFFIVQGGDLATPRLRHSGRQEAGQRIGAANSHEISTIARSADPSTRTRR